MARSAARIGAELVPIALVLASLAGSAALVIAFHRRQAGAGAEPAAVVAEAPAPPPVVAVAPPKPEPVAAPEPEPIDPTPGLVAAIAAETEAARTQAGAVAGRVAETEQALAALEAETLATRRRIGQAHDVLAERVDRAVKLVAEAEEIARERDILVQQRDAERQKLARDQARAEDAYAVVPYRGPSGTWRRPIPIECRDNRVTIQPGGPSFGTLELGGVSARSSPIVAAVGRELSRIEGQGAPDGTGAVPYVLFLIRPDGVRSYYEARGRLEALGIAFGYELVDADTTLDFPDLDDAREWPGLTPRPSSSGAPGGPAGGGVAARPGGFPGGPGAGGRPGLGGGPAAGAARSFADLDRPERPERPGGPSDLAHATGTAPPTLNQFDRDGQPRQGPGSGGPRSSLGQRLAGGPPIPQIVDARRPEVAPGAGQGTLLEPPPQRGGTGSAIASTASGAAGTQPGAVTDPLRPGAGGSPAGRPLAGTSGEPGGLTGLAGAGPAGGPSGAAGVGGTGLDATAATGPGQAGAAGGVAAGPGRPGVAVDAGAGVEPLGLGANPVGTPGAVGGGVGSDARSLDGVGTPGGLGVAAEGTGPAPGSTPGGSRMGQPGTAGGRTPPGAGDRWGLSVPESAGGLASEAGAELEAGASGSTAAGVAGGLAALDGRLGQLERQVTGASGSDDPALRPYGEGAGAASERASGPMGAGSPSGRGAGRAGTGLAGSGGSNGSRPSGAGGTPAGAAAGQVAGGRGAAEGLGFGPSLLGGGGASGGSGSAGGSGQPGGQGQAGGLAGGAAGGQPGGSGGGAGQGGDGSTITIERPVDIDLICGPSGVTIEPGGYRISLKTLESGQLLRPRLEALVQRHATPRGTERVEPKPVIHYRVEPGGESTFWQVRRQMSFSGQDWPSTLNLAEGPAPASPWLKEVRR